jgi:NAD+ synthase
MSLLYYHAELRQYAVVGTANKNEHDQGFFVKYGDGGVDVQPLAHLYKSQVYQLAAQLGVPSAIRERTPTTDTYSAATSQEDFFFRMPFETMDLLWYAHERGVPISEVVRASGLTVQQIERAYSDFTRKHRAAAYLRTEPISLGRNERGLAAAADATLARNA